MGWGNGTGNTFALRSINSYAEAKAKYDGTKQIRGSANIRPLGSRKYGHTAGIVCELTVDTSPNYYAAKLYQTECIKWWKPINGVERIEVSVANWPTPTTTQFVNYSLPHALHAQLSRHVIRINGWAVPRGESLVLENTGENGTWQAVNVQPEYTHNINRTKANAVRGRYKNFRNWLKGTLSLKNETFTEGEVQQCSDGEGQRHHNERYSSLIQCESAVATMFLDLISTPDDVDDKYDRYMLAAVWVAWRHGRSRGHAVTGRWAYNYHMNMSEFDKVLLALHAEEVLVKSELPRGTVKHDYYSAWLR
jgi:hypothetical protein